MRILHGYAKARYTTDDPITVAVQAVVTKVKVRAGYARAATKGRSTATSARTPVVAVHPGLLRRGGTWVPVAGTDEARLPVHGAGTSDTGLDRPRRDRLQRSALLEARAGDADPCPSNVNFDTSDSRAISGAIVLNDARGFVEASIVDATVLTSGVSVSAVEGCDDRGDRRSITAEAAGGSTLTGQGAALAAGGVLATNRVLSGASAFVEGGTVTVVGGDLTDRRREHGHDHGHEFERDVLRRRVRRRRSSPSTRSAGGPSNVLFAAVDALLGDPLISERLRRRAAVE